MLVYQSFLFGACSAFVYGNEPEVGAAFEEKMLNPKTRVCTRNDVFVTSKLWNTKHHPDDVVDALRTTLKSLKLDCLDLYLMHFPTSFKRGDNNFPKTADGGIDYGDIIDPVDTYLAMEECVRLGLTRHIGLSNFNHLQVNQLSILFFVFQFYVLGVHTVQYFYSVCICICVCVKLASL